MVLKPICLCFLSLDQYTVYFFTPKEAVAKAFKLGHQVIRVGGMVKGQSVQWRPKELSLKFVLSDLKETNIDVVYEGAPPDMFKENSGVVVEGLLDKEGNEFGRIIGEFDFNEKSFIKFLDEKSNL